ncbi:MAG: PAS domain S-box protein [Bacteroidales bacterium]|nr:PAS domain S-box protein [Bacteroidales bacterium]
MNIGIHIGNKSMNNKKGELPLALSRYKDSDFALQQRVRLVFYFSVSAIIGLALIVLSTAYIQVISSDYGKLYLPIIFSEFSMAVIFIIALFLLMRGLYGFAVHLLLISSLSAVWFVMWIDKSEVIARLDTIVIIVAILSMMPLFIIKYQKTIIAYILANVIVLFVFVKIFRQQFSISNASVDDFLVDTSFAIIFTGIAGYSTFRINKKSIDRAISDTKQRKYVETALEKSENNFREMTDLLPQTVFEADLCGRLTYVNKSGFEIFGYNTDDFHNGINIFSAIIHEEQELAFANMKRLIDSETNKGYIYTAVRKDKTTFPIQAYTSRILENQKPIGFRGIIIDITERKNAERALKESEFKFKSLFEASSDAIFIMNKSKFLDCNSKTSQVFGCGSDKIIGHSPAEFSPKSQPDGRESWEKAQEMINAALAGIPQFFEWLYKKYNGAEFYAEVSLNRIMIKGEYLLHAIVRDISERKKTEKALKESEERYRTIIDAFPDIIMISDQNGDIVFANDQLGKITGINPNDFSNQNIAAYIHPDDFYMVKEAIQSLISEDTIYTGIIEYRMLDSSESNHWFSGIISKITLNDQILLQSILRDITEKKSIEKELLKHQNNLEQLVDERTEELKITNVELIETNKELNAQRLELEEVLKNLQSAQKQLVQAEKMASLGILAAGVAHEINNPLNFINGGIQGINNYFIDNLSDHLENVTPLINAVNVGVSRAAEIVKSLNRFSRQTESIAESCDIHSIIDNCLVMLSIQIKNRINVVKRFTNDAVTLVANEGKLYQAILNILSNAIQAIDGEGSITIATSLVENEIVLTIADSGHGIPKENLSRIFDPFFTTKEPGKGTGLGLSISYQIIKEFSGAIEIQSEVEKGTSVIIKLPT